VPRALEFLSNQPPNLITELPQVAGSRLLKKRGSDLHSDEGADGSDSLRIDAGTGSPPVQFDLSSVRENEVEEDPFFDQALGQPAGSAESFSFTFGIHAVILSVCRERYRLEGSGQRLPWG
jgi:hypothetical protein